jgi:hypothetical protein
MSIIKTLSESKSFPSIKHLERIDLDTLCELAVLNFCTLYILHNIPETKAFANKYISVLISANHTHFKRWATGGNDQYAVLYGICNDEKEKKKVIPVGLNAMDTWLTQLKRDSLTKIAHTTFFTRLDYNFQIKNASLKAVRRLVSDWTNLNHEEKQFATTRLLQMIRSRNPKNDLLHYLEQAAHHHDLELHDVCNKDTGDGCGHTEYGGAQQYKQKPEKNTNWVAGAAAMAAGYGLARWAHGRKVTEDDAGGAALSTTSSSNIATHVKPLGNTVIKRT